MSFTALVPARMASNRLPNKPLADIAGKPMIVRVMEQAQQSGAARVIAATDSSNIADAVREAGFEATLTGECASGTERVARAAKDLAVEGIVVNVQGDEPTLDPQTIRSVAERASAGDCDCATAAAPINCEQAANPNVVKVVADKQGKAIYFSRCPIPHGASGQLGYLGHIGVYAFAPGFLSRVIELEPCALEKAERLEQLRWLWHGWNIAVVSVASFSHGIDTADDLNAVRARLGQE